MKRCSYGLLSLVLIATSSLFAGGLATASNTTIHMDMYLIAERIGVNLSTQRVPVFGEFGYTYLTGPNTDNDPTSSLYAGLGITGPLDAYGWSSAKLAFGPMVHSQQTWSDFDQDSLTNLESDAYASVNLALHIHPKVALHLRGTKTWQGLSFLQGGVSWELQ
jgi:hypothetical protein